ncbi:cAMP-dependent protein kinase inhibitor alpha isoform X1 [Oryctolagus cuniculus]|uniref:cAMP-dependent protein kinase inhibitor alpha isoform X1 n=1 Tax=Oryctolagus cuniculus TaxID=9986 RepID=UPI0007EE3396|nr:cAMP-dependent protein kinase inhibitor alpha isoform X1 [Oryctolagus cuniculus]
MQREVSLALLSRSTIQRYCICKNINRKQTYNPDGRCGSWAAARLRSLRPGEVPLPPRLELNVVIRPGAGDDFMRPELGGGSGSCSWQVGVGARGADHAHGPARLDFCPGHRAPGTCADWFLGKFPDFLGSPGFPQ